MPGEDLLRSLEIGDRSQARAERIEFFNAFSKQESLKDKLAYSILTTMLSAFKMIRERSQDDVEQGRFDPLTMTTSTDYSPGEGLPPIRLRERAFTPTEITLLFQLARMSVLNIWGGTAGNWGKRAIQLDEFEIMVVAQKAAP